MKRRKKLKIISISTLVAVLISSLASCGNNSDGSSESKSETTTTAYTSATSAQTATDSSSVATTQILLGTTSQTKTTPKAVKPKLADIKFAYGLPVCSEINARKINANMIESPDSNSPNFSSSDIDIKDDGINYYLGIDCIECKYAVNVSDYWTFIEKSVDRDSYEVIEEKWIYELKKGTHVLTCLGDDFTLVSYTHNDMGRSTAEFIGKDGKRYTLRNDMSPYEDNNTKLQYFIITEKGGKDVTKKKTFDKDTYIEIPHNKAENTGMKYFIENSPDDTSGTPAGFYMIQFDKNGTIVQINGY